jgi:hypothetical protein
MVPGPDILGKKLPPQSLGHVAQSLDSESSELENCLAFCRNQSSSYACPAWAIVSDQLPLANLQRRSTLVKPKFAPDAECQLRNETCPSLFKSGLLLGAR